MPDTVSEARVVFAEELLRSMRQMTYVLVTLSIPVILLLVFAGVTIFRAVSEGPEREQTEVMTASLTGVVNLSADLNLPALFPGLVALSTREEAVQALLDGSISELYVVPADYLQTGSLEWLTASSRERPTGADSSRIADLLRAAVAGEQLPPEILERALSPATFDRLLIGEDGETAEDDGNDFNAGRFLLGFFGSLMLIFSIAMGGSALLKSVAEEKENRMIEVLLTSARPISIMLGKVLAIGLAGLFQMAVWMTSFLLVTPRIFGAFPDASAFDFELRIVAILLFFFLGGYFLGAVIMAGIGAATTGVREANQFSAIVIMPAVVPFWAMGGFFSSPDGALPTALSMFPLTAAVAMSLRMALGEPPVLHLLLSGASLVVSSALLLWLSARVFRAGLLMYGQRMSVGQLWTALRQAGS